MLTKEQKKQSIAHGEDSIGKSAHILFADFTGVSTAHLRTMRMVMRELGGTFTVIKKRLLKIALKNKGIDFDPTRFDRQAALIALPGEIYGGAAKIYALVKQLAKAKVNLIILGGVDIANKKEISAEEFIIIAKLPSREVLLTHIACMLTIPIKKIMVALNARLESRN